MLIRSSLSGVAGRCTTKESWQVVAGIAGRVCGEYDVLQLSLVDTDDDHLVQLCSCWNIQVQR